MAGDAGDEAGHPVVAVDEVGLDGWEDVVGDLALEGEGDEVVFRGRVDLGLVVEDAVFGEVDAFIGEGFGDAVVFAVEEFAHFEVEHAAVVGEGDVDVGALVVEGFDERGGDVGEAARFGAEALGEVAHARG